MTGFESMLVEQPFLKGLSENHIKILAECARDVSFEAGQCIIQEGKPADKFYIVSHGKVAIQVFAEGRGAITIETLQAGDVLGWSWLVEPYRWQFDAKAMALTRAISLDGNRIRNACEKNHDLGYELMKRFVDVIAKRLQATRFQLLDIYGQHV